MKKIIKYILNKIENTINFFNIKRYGIQTHMPISNINGILRLYNAGEFIISNNVRINSKYCANPIGGQTFTSFFVKKSGKLTIGNGCGISNSTIVCFSKVTIGNNVFIGGGCRIYDTDFHSLDYRDRIIYDHDAKSKEVYIDDNAFIGAFAIILKGVHIGENSIVGAGSVVAKNIPANEIWAGNPAIKIKNINCIKDKHLC